MEVNKTYSLFLQSLVYWAWLTFVSVLFPNENNACFFSLSGIFAVPKELCALQYVKALKLFIDHRGGLREIHFVDTDNNMVRLIQHVFDNVLERGKEFQPCIADYVDKRKDNRRVPQSKTSDPEVDGKVRESVLPKLGVDGECSGKIVYNVTTCVTVTLVHTDLVKMQDVDVAVCSEDRVGSSRGAIAKRFAEEGGAKYNKAKKDKFLNKDVVIGSVITTVGGDNSFKHICHVVVEAIDAENLEIAYEKVFVKVKKLKARSIAFPLLATGNKYVL